jgi:hypothetical protein
MYMSLGSKDIIRVYLEGVLQENVERADAVLGYVDLLHPTEFIECPVTHVEVMRRSHHVGQVVILLNGNPVVRID